MASIKRLKQHQLPQYCNLVTEVLHKELSSHEVMSYQQIVHLQQAPVCTCSPAISNHLILQPERAFFWLAAHSAFTSSPFADKRSVSFSSNPSSFINSKLSFFRPIPPPPRLRLIRQLPTCRPRRTSPQLPLPSLATTTRRRGSSLLRLWLQSAQTRYVYLQLPLNSAPTVTPIAKEFH